MKQHADKRSTARVSDIQIGDIVLICQRKQKFDPPPFRVVRHKGTMTTASQNGKYVSHNISHFKKISSPMEESDTSSEDDADDTDILPEGVIENVPQNDVPDTQRYRDKIGDQLDDMDKMYTDSEADLVNNMNWVLNSCIVYYFA